MKYYEAVLNPCSSGFGAYEFGSPSTIFGGDNAAWADEGDLLLAMAEGMRLEGALLEVDKSEQPAIYNWPKCDYSKIYKFEDESGAQYRAIVGLSDEN